MFNYFMISLSGLIIISCIFGAVILNQTIKLERVYYYIAQEDMLYEMKVQSIRPPDIEIHN